MAAILRTGLFSLLALVYGAAAQAAEPVPPAEAIRFNRDIRPILSENCFQCHGPDQKNRKADLRLDLEEHLRRTGKDALLIPGKPADSEVFQRLITTVDDERMPPPTTGKKLSPRQIDLLRRWIEQGAKWEQHWSLLPPQTPTIPTVRQANWVRNPIDNFILERLEREGLVPSPEADPATLLRRVTLDLTGLPPTPEELSNFLADTSPSAYEKVVDRLLKSPRYGERMASRWLDGARYADTNGYQTDGPREMWRWRDWVIDAYNQNMPFDQFTIEQIAGDRLPNPTRDQLIATGFHRNLRGNGEGGIIPEEYLAEYAADRVETTCTVWLGLTMMCSRCHDHKYDPFSQREYYQLFAFFNNIPERGRTIKVGNTPPLIRAPTKDQEQAIRQTEEKIAQVETQLKSLRPTWEPELKKWISENSKTSPVNWMIDDSLDWQASFEKNIDLQGTPTPPSDKSKEAPKADAPKVQKTDPKSLKFVPGRIGEALVLDGEHAVILGDDIQYDYQQKFSFSFWVKFAAGAQGTIMARVNDNTESLGISFVLDSEQRLNMNFVARWLDDAMKVRTAKPLQTDTWQHVAILYDGSRFASGVDCYLDGKPQTLDVLQDELVQAFLSKEPFKLGKGNSEVPPFKGLIDELRTYHRVLLPEEVAILAVPETISQIATIDESKRTVPQQRKLEAWYLETQSPEPVRKAWREARHLQRTREQQLDATSSVMIMQEMPTPKETFILQRGQYDHPGEKVSRQTPRQLLTLTAENPQLPSRLDLARWLVSKDNPLTARVTVNRFWQMYFNTGIVKTVDDFGSQGEWPTHPELLDWLATEFVRTGWNVKALQKQIVMSATYRQSSRVTPALSQRDPENRLLARGPRQRLPAEMIRDQALAVSGLFKERIGGPSVKPYQPEGLWNDLSSNEYKPDTGDDLYRRSLYTYWKRTIAPPALMVFDAAGRETCIVRETRTNTPLQALTVMNDVTFMEAARMLARRVLLESASQRDEERLADALERSLARPPRPAEVQLLLENLRAQREYFQKHPEAASKLLKTGEAPLDPTLNATEWAAYTAVANLILNLDELLNKQ